MERKNVQRIVGVLVIVALAIVVMPLMFGKSDLPAQQMTSMKAPPFPDQSASGTLVANNQAVPAEAATGTDATDAPATVEITPSMAQDINDATNVDHQAANNEINAGVNTTGTLPIQNPAPAVTATAAPVANNPAPAASAPTASVASAAPVAAPTTTPVAPAAPQPVIVAENNVSAADQVVAQPAAPEAQAPAVAAPATVKKVDDVVVSSIKPKHAVMKVKAASAKKMKAGITAHAKTKAIKDQNWVIQMGAFSVKANALRLTDKLRASGYKAFFHDVKTASGKTSTHVYIGPETRVASVKLSSKVSQDMKIQGIVVPYKPLTI